MSVFQAWLFLYDLYCCCLYSRLDYFFMICIVVCIPGLTISLWFVLLLFVFQAWLFLYDLYCCCLYYRLDYFFMICIVVVCIPGLTISLWFVLLLSVFQAWLFLYDLYCCCLYSRLDQPSAWEVLPQAELLQKDLDHQISVWIPCCKSYLASHTFVVCVCVCVCAFCCGKYVVFYSRGMGYAWNICFFQAVRHGRERAGVAFALFSAARYLHSSTTKQPTLPPPPPSTHTPFLLAKYMC